MTSNKKLVSIVIPLYNSEKYIESTIKSLLNQDYPNKEIIIVDDGSKDNSGKTVKKFSEKHRNIKYIYQENQGAPSARNKGFEHSNGEYIIFFDSDDIMTANSLSELVKGSQNFSKDLVIGNYSIMNDIKVKSKNKSGKFFRVYNDYQNGISKELLLRKITDLPPVPSSKMYKKEFLQVNNLKFSNLKIGQDLNFYLKSIAKYPNVSIINNEIFSYRIHENSISSTYDDSILDIINVYKDIKIYDLDFYKKYYDIINTSKFKNYMLQIMKVPKINNKNMRHNVYNTLREELKNTRKHNIDKNLLGKYPLIKLLFSEMICKLGWIYTSNLLNNLYHLYYKK
ncbi:glycosyltransferase family 2 protein [Aerococcaceae bacterium DSM 111022]|nr:glycosyltransferase family 2 protein [Aerococcaceae bacterium DSM 111022]